MSYSRKSSKKKQQTKKDYARLNNLISWHTHLVDTEKEISTEKFFTLTWKKKQTIL